MLPKDKPELFFFNFFKKLGLGIASIDLLGLRNLPWLHPLPQIYLGCLKLWEGQWLVLGLLTLGLKLCLPSYIVVWCLKNSSTCGHFQVNSRADAISTKDPLVCGCACSVFSIL